MNGRLRVGIVGIGSRFDLVYAPILKGLCVKQKIQVVSVVNRTIGRAAPYGQVFECPIYSNLTSIPDGQMPDLMIVTVAHDVKDSLVENLLSRGVSCYVETPAALSRRKLEEMRCLARANNALLEFSFDQAFWPEAQFESKIVRSGLLGQVKLVVNDSHLFSYHAFSRALRILDMKEDTSCQSSGLSFRDDRSCYEHHVFSHGRDRMFIYQYAQPRSSLLRVHRSWKVYGEKGVLDQNQLILDRAAHERQRYNVVTDIVNPGQLHLEVVREISVTLEKDAFVWKNPWGDQHFTRAQVGVKTLLDQMIEVLKDREKKLLLGIEGAMDIMKLQVLAENTLRKTLLGRIIERFYS